MKKETTPNAATAPDRRAFLTPFLLITLLTLFSVCVGDTLAQSSTTNSTDFTTPPALTPGAPAGSYELSGFDNVNLFNGNLNFHLPFGNVTGRGGANMRMLLTLEQRWRVERSEGDTYCCHYDNHYPEYNWWTGIKPGYGPGVLHGRTSILLITECFNGNQYVPAADTIVSRLTFTAPDGTEYELHDQLNNGRPMNAPPCASQGASRGTIFVTADGNAATFVSDAIIYDDPYSFGEGYELFYPSGYFLLADGTRYRIDSGRVSWMRDRNGNKLAYDYDQNNRVISIKDSLNRTITIEYDIQDVQPYGLCDRISFSGFQGSPRKIRISKTSLGNALRADYVLNTEAQLFPELNGTCGFCGSFNPTVIYAVWLPDGRSYRFYYNSYAELARVELPTGGAYEYEYAGGVMNAPASGVVSQWPYGTSGPQYQIYRRVVEKRIYAAGASLESRIAFSVPESQDASGNRQNIGYVVEDNLTSTGSLLTRKKHYFYNYATNDESAVTGFSSWRTGQEYQTDSVSSDGTVVQGQVVQTWQQRASVPWWVSWASHFFYNPDPDSEPQNDSRVTEILTTLADTNQVSKMSFSYDDSVPYNNKNNVKEYDFGSGVPGVLLRETRTTFMTTTAYTGTSVHLRRLPTEVSVYNAGGVERGRSTFEYDNYGLADSYHASIVTYPRAGFTELPISGLDASFNSSSNNLTRGNVTKTTRTLFDITGNVVGSISGYAQYDVAGNVVKTIDPRSTPTNLIITSQDFSDHFGTPDGEARANSSSTELNNAGQYTYGFPTSVTNALGHRAYTQFDYYLGRPVDAEDANGIVSSGYYNDALDRPMQVRRAVGTSLESQTTFTYDDVNRIVTTTSDQATFSDNVLKSQIVYDGLGRAIEARQYENSTQYIARQQVPFIVLQDPDTGAFVSAVQSSNPFRPYLGEQPVWTTTFADALGRTTKVRTPDNAIVRTTYSGSSVTLSDQTSRQRKSISDALGRLKEVYEAPNDAVNYNYLTSYDYDVLGNLQHVYQGSQTRTFTYDSLSRLATATNPESGTINYQYDANGNLTQKSDARGVVTTFAPYDPLNRPTTRSYSDGTPTVNYSYDAVGVANSKGKLTSISSSVSTYNYSSYDALGRVKTGSETLGSQTYSMVYGYDLAGHVKSINYPSGHTVSYNYDGAGRLGDADAQNLAFTGNLGDGTQRNYSTGLTYSTFGGLSQEQFGTSIPIYNKLFYNIRGQLAEIREGLTPNNTSWQRGAVINHYSNGYGCWGASCSAADNNGNLMKQEHWIQDGNDNVQAILTQQYEYDQLNRLKRVYDGANWQQAYADDRFGNRSIDVGATWGQNINNLQTAVDTIKNRLYAPGETDANHPLINYDPAGNQIKDYYSDPVIDYDRTYDAENRMVSATKTSNQTSLYSYDAAGRRVVRNENTVVTWQIYGLGGELLAEYAANTSYSSPQKEYGYRNGQLLITAEAGTTSAPAPSSLVATPPTSGTSITLGWTASSGATNYRVERKAAAGSYTLAGTTTAITLTDNTAASGNAYLYKVCAANAQGNCTSAYSNIALGATVTFPTDSTIKTFSEDPLNATSVKPPHITELRSAVNAVRMLAGLSAAAWTYPNIATGGIIHVEDVRDLRIKLGEALTVLGIQTPTYTDSTIKGFIEDPLNATTIRAAHIRELRQRATSGIGGSGGSGGASLEIHWLVNDQLGTPRMVFDVSGSLANVSRHDYLPFGEELFAGTGGRTPALGYTNSDGARQKFTSKERDIETGLDYSMHRYYSNVQGRFTSVDPENAGAYPGNPQTWNGYSYALNQPMLYSDPDGLKVRVCGTDGQCTDSNTDLTDEQWNNWFGRDKSVKLKGGNIYKNGELIGTYQQLSCDSCYYDIFELGRQVTRADPGGRAVRLYGKAALAGLTLPGTAAGWISIGVFSVIVPVYNEPDEDVFAASIQADRQAAVRDAWKQEAERARTGQPTKTPFTADELRELRDTGRVSGYEGHHTESVSGNPQSARDASKIEFVKGRAAHLSEHGGNWRNRTPLPKRR